jgi:hypothetical protein
MGESRIRNPEKHPGSATLVLWYCSYSTRIYARNDYCVPLGEKLEESVYPRLASYVIYIFWSARCVQNIKHILRYRQTH